MNDMGRKILCITGYQESTQGKENVILLSSEKPFKWAANELALLVNKLNWWPLCCFLKKVPLFEKVFQNCLSLQSTNFFLMTTAKNYLD